MPGHHISDQQVFLFMTLGLDPAVGLSLGITKRMRKIFWIGLGWLFLSRLSRSFGATDRLGASISEPQSISDSEASR